MAQTQTKENAGDNRQGDREREQTRDQNKEEGTKNRGARTKAGEEQSGSALGAKASTVSKLSDARKKSVKLYKDFAENADTSAHDHPWTFVGAASLAGILVGLFLGRRA
jgi:ElaB/YqjD/DUF883 family membrane-anchored ribosome-binding protein